MQDLGLCKVRAIAWAKPKLIPFNTGQVKQMVRIMKLTSIIILTTCLQASAVGGNSQTVTFNLKDAPMNKVFEQIEKQTEYRFVFSWEALKKARNVTLSVKEAVITEVLAICFKDQPISYLFSDKIIIVKDNQQLPFMETQEQDQAPTIDVKGRVVDENSDPVEGVNVTVKGTSNVTSTSLNGEFILKTIEPDAVLLFTSVNMETFEVSVKGRLFMEVTLQTKITAMREVLINKGYYTEKRILATGNVASLKSKDIEKQPVQNPLLALIGRVAGVTIEQQSGFANSGIVVRIQGRNSINSGLNPFYVIDGVPFLSQPLPTVGLADVLLGTSGADGAGGGSPLSLISPNDIESIDILKDADATAIYGSRGANGVILITTKKGKPGKTKVNANFRTGWGRVNNKVDLLNTEQYLQMRKEAFVNDGRPVPDQTTAQNNSNYDLTFWDQNRHTDWQKVLIGGTAKYTDAQVSISGGSTNTQFLISTGYHLETTVFPDDFADKKGSFQFNLNHSSNNQKFKIQTSGIYTVYDNQLPVKDLTYYAVNIAPNAPSLYNPDGSLNWAPINLSTGTISTWLNPVADYLLSRYNNRVNTFIGSSFVNYQLLPSLSVGTRLGYTNMHSDEVNVFPLSAIRPEQQSTTNRSAHYGNGSSRSWIIEPQLTYNVVVGEGKLEALAGSSFQQVENIKQSVNGNGYSSDLVLKNLASAATLTPGLTLYSQYKYNAVFSRVNYDFKERYIVNLTARRDGSSRFGSENLFNNFWGIAGSWILSNENWFSENLGFVNFGKLRVSYGSSGNDQIGDYSFMNLYNPVSDIGVPYQGIPAMSPDRHSNPYLQWEETQKLQFGLDLGLIKDRIIFNMNYYLNRSSNLLIPTSLSYITGFNLITENFEGVLENRGWEFTLSSFNIKKPNFSWTTNVNLTIPERNGHLVSFPDFSTSIYANTYAVGRSINDVKRYQYLRVDPATGLYVFSDDKGNPTNSPVTKDRNSFSNISQRLFGGLQNNIAYKGFELDFTLQFVRKDAPVFAGSLPGRFVGTGNVGNQPSLILSRWEKAGDQKNVQKVSVSNIGPILGFINYIQSDAGFTDASFLRLTNVSLSWQFPKTWASKVQLQSARLYLHGQNLFTITKYKGLDPSTGSSTRLPPLQVITVGGQITF